MPACLPAVVVLRILHVSDRRSLHSSRAHNYTERALEARFIHGLWSAGIAERHLEGAPKRRGNARQPTTASRLARSASEGQPRASPEPLHDRVPTLASSPQSGGAMRLAEQHLAQPNVWSGRINHDLLRQHPSPNRCPICPWRESNGYAACGL